MMFVLIMFIKMYVNIFPVAQKKIDTYARNVNNEEAKICEFESINYEMP